MPCKYTLGFGKIPFFSLPLGCFGYPEDCVESADCKVLVTYSPVTGENQVSSGVAYLCEFNLSWYVQY